MINKHVNKPSIIPTIILDFYPYNPVYPRGLDPSVLVFSLSLYRHPSICILFTFFYLL